jgi:hypothetical protein
MPQIDDVNESTKSFDAPANAKTDRKKETAAACCPASWQC